MKFPSIILSGLTLFRAVGAWSTGYSPSVLPRDDGSATSPLNQHSLGFLINGLRTIRGDLYTLKIFYGLLPGTEVLDRLSSRCYFRNNYEWNRQYKGYKEAEKRFENGSNCFARDLSVALVVDANIRRWDFSARLDSELTKPTPDLHPWVSSNGVRANYKTASPFVTVNEVRRAIAILHTRLIQMVEYLEAWSCKIGLGNDSTTYFTLFLQQINDEGPSVGFARGWNSDTALHAQDLPQRYRDAIQRHTPKFDTELNAMYDDMTPRFAALKRLMESIGGSQPFNTTVDDLARCVVITKKFKGIV
ncbi:hypothetical protein TWF694_001387 [Orbilia ellipsospora]|uniref:Uncharacterized protein n=1 Tax=Orbilia ellipsospora TaxID=2528407 RepID=A0AAV9XTB2_9PEZI